ncbi:1,2-dihydroxy-3-keto-5-methylthiopentene dioxygenase [Leptolyngbya sp. PCC 6406]|uniref:1,2-dihydroxy-3-keto-5-methylthiopentene dioxygenase n=1 Tax=Leptolyngbya sp. PCC 6406 TaxID=1173264 RepID=UPI0002ACB2C3|nr:cupin domain-containing protein [Leptolyngbya sp. PCC 6406]
MAVLSIAKENRQITELEAIWAYLQSIDLDYEQWEPAHPLSPEATAEDILTAYQGEVDRLKAAGGYVTADVINITPETPNLEMLLKKFNQEHWHDEDEVRFIISGHGLFHINPQSGPVVAIEVGPGDLLVVPGGTHHWFDLCRDRRIQAIRLFQDPAGWTPHYTETGKEKGYQPLCFGPAFVTS